jgi:large subunit ribosomal protein L31
MRRGIHPPYAPVVFRDRSTGDLTLTRSTMTSDRTIELDGTTYPVVDVDVTTASHPFWTGRGRVVDSEGRVERFRRRYGSRA